MNKCKLPSLEGKFVMNVHTIYSRSLIKKLSSTLDIGLRLKRNTMSLVFITVMVYIDLLNMLGNG